MKREAYGRLRDATSDITFIRVLFFSDTSLGWVTYFAIRDRI